MISIHIGTHKTGSTSIQAFMAAHQSALAARGLIYPDIGRNRGGGHFGLKTELRAEAELPRWTALGELAEASPSKHIVVSCEGFEYLSAPQIAAAASALRGQPVQVIGYLRERGGMVQSQYAQLSRICRNVDDFDVFFERYLAERESSFVCFERWAAVFGWSKLRIRLFDRRLLDGGDVVTDFLRVCGLDRSALGLPVSNERNQAPPWQAIEMMRSVFRAFSRAGVQDAEALQRLRQHVRSACEAAMAVSPDLPQQAVYLSQTQRQRCEALSRCDIEALNRHLPAPGLPLLTTEPTRERPFLPSIEHISSADVALAMANVSMALGVARDPTDEERRALKRSAKGKPAKMGENKGKKLARVLAEASGA